MFLRKTTDRVRDEIVAPVVDKLNTLILGAYLLAAIALLLALR